MSVDNDSAYISSLQGRLLTCCDLVAEEAVYHKNCHPDFFFLNQQYKPGHQVDSDKETAIEKVCAWLEVTDCVLLTLSELSEKAESLTGMKNVYSDRWLKETLKDHYKDHIVFAEVQGWKNVICWQKLASFIINNKQYESNDRKLVSESGHIVTAAAKLLKAAIRETQYDMKVYPSWTNLGDTDKSRK